MTGIVIGVDGSSSAARSLNWAAREAELHGWPLRAVLAWGYLDQHHPSSETRFDPDYNDRSAAAALDSYVEAAFAPAAPPPMERRTVCDLPARALIESSSDASLLVVGARGLGGFRELLLGSVSQHCVHHATCPVAIIRPEADTEGQAAGTTASKVGVVVVGVDGSPTAKRALEWALAAAVVRHASLRVVHGWHLPYVEGYPYGVMLSNPEVFDEAARAIVDEALAGLDTSELAHPVERIVSVEGPASAILSAAHDADMIVVGSRGRGGFAGLLLGSVSHHVAHHAECPVVIVPPEQ